MVRDFFENVWNGLKRAVKFVIDVLLFVPRCIIKGVKSFVSWLQEDEDDENSSSVELVEKPVKEKEVNVPSTDNKAVPFAVAGVALGAAAAAREPKNDKPVEAEEPKQEVTKESKSPEKEKVTDTISKEPVDEKKLESTEKNDKPVKEEKQEVTKESKSPEKEKVTEKLQDHKKEVPADVVDTKTNKSLAETKAIVETKEEKLAVFGESDKKTAKLEHTFVEHYNNALKMYDKNLWADAATQMQKFARCYLDAIATKQNIQAPKLVSERYEQIIDTLLAKVLISPEEVKQLREFLKRGIPMQRVAVEPGIKNAYMMIESYKHFYYKEWYEAEVAKAAAKANIQTGSGAVA